MKVRYLYSFILYKLLTTILKPFGVNKYMICIFNTCHLESSDMKAMCHEGDSNLGRVRGSGTFLITTLKLNGVNDYMIYMFNINSYSYNFNLFPSP